MPIDEIVLNASPLIVIFKSELEDIFPGLFSNIVIPMSVYKEVTENLKNDRAAVILPNTNWYKVIDVKINDKIAAWDLGKGESTVLSFALEHKQFKVVIDDFAARKCAKIFNIDLLGTGSILILAKRKGLISSVGDALQKLKVSGFWISENLEIFLKTKAGEC